jgi:hypothetical protein
MKKKVTRSNKNIKNRDKENSNLAVPQLPENQTKRGEKNLFECTEPCGNCPYRTDAPLQFWSKQEFVDLLASENEYLGKVYQCHKNNGSICVGWLIDQDHRRFPSIALRLVLSERQITREYLDELKSPTPLYSSVREMIEANFPEIFDESKEK